MTLSGQCSWWHWRSLIPVRVLWHHLQSASCLPSSKERAVGVSLINSRLKLHDHSCGDLPSKRSLYQSNADATKLLLRTFLYSILSNTFTFLSALQTSFTQSFNFFFRLGHQEIGRFMMSRCVAFMKNCALCKRKDCRKQVYCWFFLKVKVQTEVRYGRVSYMPLSWQ